MKPSWLFVFVSVLILELFPTRSNARAAETLLEPDALASATLLAPSPDVAREIPVTAEPSADRSLIRAFEINAREMEFYVAQLRLTCDQDISQGDTMYVTFDARTTAVRDESGQGLIMIYFQDRLPPWNKPLLRAVPLTEKWTSYQFAFRAPRNFSPKKAGELVFGFGEREQSVEIANVTFTNHGPDVTPESLPQTRFTYEGREPDAAWRSDAAKRIDRIRKADLEVKVIDAKGRPVAGAEVSVQQKRHTFLFGSAVAANMLNEKSADADRYREIVSTWFNHVVVENALKWPALAGDWNATGDGTVEEALQWLNDQDLHIKGHVLIWPSFRNMPKAIGKLKDDPEALSAAVNHRISGATKQYGPYLDEWDVINEPFDNHDVMDLLGNNVMADWFVLAKKASPDTRLYLNDFGILTGGNAYNTPHRQHYEDTITSLLAAKAPLEGLGVQGHFNELVTPPGDLIKVLDRFSSFELPIQITEFDIDTTDQALQADYTRDFMTTVFSHPQVNGFVMWGFWEKRHWKPQAAMFANDWKIKPNGKIYHDLVFKEWWTDTAGFTSAAGTFNTRGFLGDYQITVKHAGQAIEQRFTLTAGSKPVVITLP